MKHFSVGGDLIEELKEIFYSVEEDVVTKNWFISKYKNHFNHWIALFLGCCPLFRLMEEITVIFMEEYKKVIFFLFWKKFMWISFKIKILGLKKLFLDNWNVRLFIYIPSIDYIINKFIEIVGRLKK